MKFAHVLAVLVLANSCGKKSKEKNDDAEDAIEVQDDDGDLQLNSTTYTFKQGTDFELLDKKAAYLDLGNAGVLISNHHYCKSTSNETGCKFKELGTGPDKCSVKTANPITTSGAANIFFSIKSASTGVLQIQDEDYAKQLTMYKFIVDYVTVDGNIISFYDQISIGELAITRKMDDGNIQYMTRGLVSVPLNRLSNFNIQKPVKNLTLKICQTAPGHHGFTNVTATVKLNETQNKK